MATLTRHVSLCRLQCEVIARLIPSQIPTSAEIGMQGSNLPTMLAIQRLAGVAPEVNLGQSWYVTFTSAKANKAEPVAISMS